ncbi:MAG: protein of unknown function (DUF4276) [Candidatus Kentron sp. G]|nr:MAG: protein of unknown function (DUF4276) [Candidatus Kentron sp. G]VFM95350.1 MAG: protein of unknown function (DUF4276) [Candidatus Kentron sp. G]VFM98288.1 MAG: protein of unknown function (DUF4276) [Candidatus Kentron sp. G]
MKFLLFCEGKTEAVALSAFLKRWLDERLPQPVGITPIRFEGWNELYDDVKKKAHLRLRDGDVIAVISLLDLYGPTFYPVGLEGVDGRYEWARKHMEGRVDHPRFRQFFAVHEVEAWLLSDPGLFPREIENGLPGRIQKPETVNFDEPPAKLLERLYREKKKQKYKKVTEGKALFRRLSPEIARNKCPRLAEMLDEMLSLARNAHGA